MGTYVDTNSDGPDQICPYNNNHVIPSRKFTTHILECAKNHRDGDFMTCPYHAKHRLRPFDMYEHIQLCPYLETGVVTEEQMTEYAEWSKSKSLKPEQQNNNPNNGSSKD